MLVTCLFACLFACLLKGPSITPMHLRVGAARTSVYATTETEVADQTCCLTHPRYANTRPTSPSADTITQGAQQGIHSNTIVQATGMT